LQKPLRINNYIRSSEVQVIGADGQQLGKMSTSSALKIAQESNMDLVEVGPNSQPPVTRIMDYGKYIYQKERQEKKSGKKQKDQEMKTVRVGFKTGQHDISFKARQIDEFLREGHLVKVELTLRGREKALAEMGRQKLEAFLQGITEPFNRDQTRKSPYGWYTIVKKEK